MGGFKTTVVAYLFMFDFSTFPGGLGKAQRSRSPEKSPLGKSQPGGVRPLWSGEDAVRISNGERYTGDFTPEVTFPTDSPDAPNRAVLIYDGSHFGMNRMLDLSGEWHSDHNGRVVRE